MNERHSTYRGLGWRLGSASDVEKASRVSMHNLGSISRVSLVLRLCKSDRNEEVLKKTHRPRLSMTRDQCMQHSRSRSWALQIRTTGVVERLARLTSYHSPSCVAHNLLLCRPTATHIFKTPYAIAVFNQSTSNFNTSHLAPRAQSAALSLPSSDCM